MAVDRRCSTSCRGARRTSRRRRTEPPPQTGSVFDALAAWGTRTRNLPELRVVRDFHDDTRYIAALARRIEDHWQGHAKPDKLVMSFHGLPERSRRLGDPYYDECQRTAHLLAQRLSLRSGDWVVTFKPFGRAKWLRPIPSRRWSSSRAVARGASASSAGFAADCLETLQRSRRSARRAFLDAGGKNSSTSRRSTTSTHGSTRWRDRDAKSRGLADATGARRYRWRHGDERSNAAAP
jgi:protoheme ferro-lyase